MSVRAGTIILLFLAVAIQGAPIEQTGFIEGKVGYELDTLSSGNLIHQERLSWGIKGGADKYDYSLTLGGVLRGNAHNSYTGITPEYGVRTNFKPSSRFDMAIFSYLRLRNPMQIQSDSLEYREYVHGVKLKALISRSTSLSVSTGLKSREINHRDTVSIGQQFISLNLDQKVGGMRFRLTGETDTWEREGLEGKSTGLASLHWYGSPMKRMNWSATNTLFQSGDDNFWRMAHRVRYDLSTRQKLWVNFQRGDFAYDSQTLLRQSFDVRYRFQMSRALGFDLMTKGNRVGVEDSLDIYHWRMYGASTHWQVSDKGFARGNLDVGFKESYRFGRGLDLLLNATESVNLIRGKRFTLLVQDDASAELFARIDKEDDLRYDVRHKLRLTSEFTTDRSLRYGNHLKLHNHFGSDLDFSADTLRNAIIDEIYLKSRGQKTQFALYYGTVLAMLEPENDLHFTFNTRFYRQLSPNLNFSLWNNYRFGSDIYTDHLWLNATLKYQTGMASYALMVQNYGIPDNFAKQGTSIWLRFVRHI